MLIRRRGLSGVIAGFFFVLLANSFFAVPLSAEIPVRFVFYNAGNYFLEQPAGVSDKENNAPTPKSESSIAAVVSILSDLQPDILGLAEIGPGPELEDLQNRLKSAGVDLPYSMRIGGADPLRHLALLSRFPVNTDQSLRNVAFEIGGIRHQMQRGILDATLQMPDTGELRLVGVHLKSKRPVPGFDQEEFRSREARELRKHLDGIFRENPDAPLLVWGDFNEAKNHASMRDLFGPRGAVGSLHPVELSDTTGAKWTHFWSTADLYSRIDFILLSRALLPHLDTARSGIAEPENWNEASDHRPIYITLLWN